MPINFLEQIFGQFQISITRTALAFGKGSFEQKVAKVQSDRKQKNKELVCIFLGLNFYTSPERAKILKSKVTDMLLQTLGKEDLIGIDVEPAIDLTPTFSKLKTSK